MGTNCAPYIAAEDLMPCCFIQQVPGQAYMVRTAGANEGVIGVTQEGTTLVPIDGMTNDSSIYAAREGMAVSYHGEHAVCLVIAGAAIQAGQYLISDANGHAVPANGTGQAICARALNGVQNAGEKVRVVVEIQRYAVPNTGE